ncbi:MAG: hypothetical protein OEZ06_06770 [Myxococcales bacterium]|nr:hypothetical protein [Myxococcales bacterium]
MAPRSLVLALSLAGCGLGPLACSGSVTVGHACPPEGCDSAFAASVIDDPKWPDLPMPEQCGLQLPSTGERVEANGELDSCMIFSLHALGGGSAPVYLTRMQIVMTPFSHHVDVRMTADAVDLPDGPVPCDAAWSSPARWIPLMTARGEEDDWDLSAAPYVASSHYRVLVNHHYSNNSDRARDDVGFKLNLYCDRQLPNPVSQAFSFENRQQRLVQPGTAETLAGTCDFDRSVIITRLYRRTHRIVAYRAGLVGEADWLWVSGDSTGKLSLDPDPPLTLTAGQGLRWECDYENTSDLAFQIGGGASDTCSLLGIYQLPDGRPDPVPATCTLAPR